MAVAAPVIKEEMAEWLALGGKNLGITADNFTNHPSGFHRAANEVPATDYSRRQDPNGSDGPYVDWDYACAGDFSHEFNPTLRALHRNVLARLMNGELPMICEFIGKPWADKPVYYWARWNGVKVLKQYTGSGHDKWSHISWYRSRVNQRANLWVTEDDMAFTELQMRAFPWQYNGRGMANVPEGSTTLWVMGMLYTNAAENAAKLDLLIRSVNDLVDDDIKAKLAAITTKFDADRAELARRDAEMLTAVTNVDEALLAKLSDETTPDEAVANVLRELLGPDRLPRIVDLLA